MRRKITLAGLLIFVLAPAVAPAANQSLLTLQQNPFSRPESIKPRPPSREAAPRELPAEEVKLDLTATLVSRSTPMVVVDGRLLGLGEEIEGMKLIAVAEGRAIFLRDGKKYSFEIPPSGTER